MRFDGNIIITDPCYVLKKDIEHKNDWLDSNFGMHLENIGYPGTNFLTRDTIYGDWCNSIFNCATEDDIGDFCADAGMVSVFLEEDLKKFNPKFDLEGYIESGLAARVVDFHGEVTMRVSDSGNFMLIEGKGDNPNDSFTSYLGSSMYDDYKDCLR